MKNSAKKYPECFGVLEKVFPMSQNGFRTTPINCLQCEHRTICLKKAMESTNGLRVHEEIVDRAYSSGMMGFFDRWSKKKALHQKLKDSKHKKQK